MYVLDEEKVIVNGVWEGVLNHGQVNHSSILIYRDKKLNGTRVLNYSLVKDVDNKTRIRINGSDGSVFITYETMEEILPVRDEKASEEVEGISVDRLYLEKELVKKADKVNTFTKEEVVKRLELVKGVPGPEGPQGDQGIQGIQGIKGDKGDQGIQGIKGESGYTPVKGLDYFDGAPGPKGDKGDQGIQGIQGIQGPKGDKGDPGEVVSPTGPFTWGQLEGV